MKTKVNKILKDIVLIIGIALLLAVFIGNLIFTSSMDLSEVVSIKVYSIVNLLITVLIAFIIYLIGSANNLIEKYAKNHKNINVKVIQFITLVVMLIVYFALQMIWINYRRAYPIADQYEVYEGAKALYEGNDTKLMKSQYYELYPQQLTLASIWATIFRIFNTSNVKLLQCINAFANVITMFAIYLIIENLGKKYKVNGFRPMLVYMLFLTIPLLSTFVYGDETSLAFSMLSVYFIMKYGECHKVRYLIASALCMSLSYALRMNNLIWILAVIIYLTFNILEKSKIKDENQQVNSKQKKQIDKVRDTIIEIVLIIIFTAISILPATIIKTNMQKKYELNPDNKFPTTGFICMGMTDGYRQAGWYNSYANYAWKDVESSKEIYPNVIKDRVKFFAKNPIQMIRFYVKKTLSIWSENTYAGVWYNQTNNFEKLYINQSYEEGLKKDEKIISLQEELSIYQKALILLIFGYSIIVLLKNRNNLSNELLLLLIIFIGGFLFHTIWEAKSRYIIPYIVALIPIIAINFQPKVKAPNSPKVVEREEK